MDSPAILYFGMFGELSRRPLAALLARGARLAAVVVPGVDDGPEPEILYPPATDPPGPESVPLVSQYMQPSAITLAWEHKIPLLSISALARPAAVETLAAFRADLICVSCFPKIIPPAVLGLPRLGALNLHPSLLPRYRGPAPLFWQFRDGTADTGVTVHYMTGRLDAGDIVLQAPVPFSDGLGGPEAEAQCADAGAALLVQAVDLVNRGAAPRRPQVEAGATYFPLPGRADLALSTAWPARRAFNFIRGAGSPASPLPFEIDTGQATFRVLEALSYTADGHLPAAYEIDGDEVAIQFKPGVLWIRVDSQASKL